MSDEAGPRPALRQRAEQGSALVETALSAVLLLTVIFGCFEISLAFYSYHFVSEAAREATRYAIVRGSSCSGFSSACPASANDIQSFVRNLNFPGIDPNNLAVTTTWSPTSAGGSCAPSAACDNPGNQVQVTVTYSLPLRIPFVPSQLLNLTSTSEMVISQ